MKLRAAFRLAWLAAKANVLPGLLLQALLLVFLGAYIFHDGTRHFLAGVAQFKDESGYAFAFFSYVISSALLPELLKIGFFQGLQIRRNNVYDFLTGAPAWGLMGILVDFFYRQQTQWFGANHDFTTIMFKMLMDQFVFSPFLSVPLSVTYFRWRDARFSWSALKSTARFSFISECFLPAQVAGWCIWIPAVCLVYFMPSALQLPVATLIQTFWVLVFTLVNGRRADGPQRTPKSLLKPGRD
jgi:hypothetical protein